MTIRSQGISLILMTSLLFIVGACQKPDTNTPEQEERTNYFVYDGYSFDISSVVQYDKGDSSFELWLSPVSGLKTSADIKKNGDYVVLNTHASYLGSRDRFNSQTSKDSYIEFAGNRKFGFGDSGIAYIDAAVEGDQVTLDFLAQNLYTKGNDPETNADLHGKYSGSFVIEKEKPYVNEWGFNREHNSIDKVIMTMREDDGDWSISMLHKDGSEALRIVLPSDMIGQEILAGSEGARNVTLLYNGGVEFPLKDAAGWIRTLNGENSKPLTVSISLVKGNMHLRAEYAGGFTPELIKLNRYTFDYDGESPYEGEYSIVMLMVEDLGSRFRFYFSPSEGYSIGNANSTHMPVLTVPKTIINAGTQTFQTIKDWSFEYDVMQVGPFMDEYKPYPSEYDTISINYADGEYEIDMNLTGVATGMNTSRMDLYYKGLPQN